MTTSTRKRKSRGAGEAVASTAAPTTTPTTRRSARISKTSQVTPSSSSLTKKQQPRSTRAAQTPVRTKLNSAQVPKDDSNMDESDSDDHSAVSGDDAEEIALAARMKYDDDDNDGDNDENENNGGFAAPSSSSSKVNLSEQKSTIRGTHPRGVVPLGNLLGGGPPSIRQTGLGPRMSALPDATIMHLLKFVSADYQDIKATPATQPVNSDAAETSSPSSSPSFCPTSPSTLVSLTRVCRSFYVLCGEEEVWRSACLDRWGGMTRFRSHTWRETYAFMHRLDKWKQQRGKITLEQKEREKEMEREMRDVGSSGRASSSAPFPSSSSSSLPPLPSDDPEDTNDDSALPLWVTAPLPAPFKIRGFYSDYLFQSFYCAHVDLIEMYGGGIEIEEEEFEKDEDAEEEEEEAGESNGKTGRNPSKSLSPLHNPTLHPSSIPKCDTIPRVHVSELTLQRFRDEFGRPNKPVIITGLMDEWGAYGGGSVTGTDSTAASSIEKPHAWNLNNWLKSYGNCPFKVGRYVMRLEDYFSYLQGVREDESPLYLFDSRYGEKHPELLAQYKVPPYFQTDFFSYIGNKEKEEKEQTEEEKSAPSTSSSPYPAPRPAYRWILVGPSRSGSTFHKDPNHTSAWNGLISGIKKWYAFNISHITPSAPRLVCVELNHGPPRPAKLRSQQLQAARQLSL